jgi:hypothetical protein
MQITMKDLKGYIEKAKECGACEDDIKDLEAITSVEELLVHEETPYWAYWYAKNVLRISEEELFQ